MKTIFELLEFAHLHGPNHLEVEAAATRFQSQLLHLETPIHPDTFNLVQRSASALAKKLQKAEIKYGFTNHWARPDWQGQCQQELTQHVRKGDPLDVMAYAAFCWHHGWSTTNPTDPQVLHQLLITAHLMYKMVLRDGPSQMYERVMMPQPGDIVVETTTLWKSIYHGFQHGIGILVHTEKHWPHEPTDLPRDQWHTVPHRTVHFVESLHDGNLYPWDNCHFIALPDNPMELSCLENGSEINAFTQSRIDGDIEARKRRARDAYRRHPERLESIPEPYSEA